MLNGELAQETAEAPIFDFEDISWGESKQLSRLLLRLGGMITDGGDSADAITEIEKIEAAIAPYIVSVPRSWLVKRAPASIDWQTTGALNHLRRARFGDLLAAVAVAVGQIEKKASN